MLGIHYPCSRAVFTGQPVNTGSVYRPLGLQKSVYLIASK